MMVHVFLANGFEEIEALTPVDILRRGGIEVMTVSVTGDRTVTGARKIPVIADATIFDPDLPEPDMIVLPGGAPGYINLASSEELKEIILASIGKKYIAAICAAPTILGRMGLLEGKKATCYPGMEGDLRGAVVTRENVVSDGKIITSNGMGSALEFAIRLLEILAGKECADKTARSVVMH